MFVCFVKYSSVINLDLFWKQLFSHNMKGYGQRIRDRQNVCKSLNERERTRGRKKKLTNIKREKKVWQRDNERVRRSK